MSSTMTASQIIDRDFLEIRCRILEVAASLDRIDQGADPSAVGADARMSQLQNAIRVLVDGKADRAPRVQIVFSDSYDESWRGS